MDFAQLVISNVIGVVVFLLIPLIIYIIRSPARIEEKAHSLTEYISLQIFRSKLKRTRLFSGIFLGYPLPKNWIQVIRVFGFACSWGIVFVSLQATFAWWATNEWSMDWYKDYRSIFNFRGYPIIELVPAMIVFFLMGYFIFNKEYKTYKLKLSEKTNI